MLMKSVLKIFVLFISIGLFLPVFAFAQSPSLPHQFFGAVNFSDGLALDGFVVEARINGVVVGNSITAGGNYGYNPNLLFALDNQGVYAGETVEFYVDGIKANETAIFANGNSSQINLTIPASIPTTPTPTPTPSGGGGGGGIPPTKTVAQKVDMDNNSKVDVLDFNTLMVHWGETGSNNIADINSDGEVDVFDFNLLMINWTL